MLEDVFDNLFDYLEESFDKLRALYNQSPSIKVFDEIDLLNNDIAYIVYVTLNDVLFDAMKDFK